MCDSYARSLLRVSVAQICQALGWDAVQLTACDQLSDVLHRYIQQLARGCHRYSELYGRTDPVLDDVGQAFRLLGVSLSELEDYIHNLEPVGFSQQTPLFPVSKNNVMQFPQPGFCNTDERKDYIPDYMPALVSLREEEEEEEVLAEMGTSAEAMQVPLEDEEDMEDDETVNDENCPMKRHLDSPDFALGIMPTAKRPRLQSGISPDWAMEPREPLTSLNSQLVPPTMLAAHDLTPTLSPETPAGPPPSFRAQSATPRLSDQKSPSAHGQKQKISSPGKQSKSTKGVNPNPVCGSPIRSPNILQKKKRKSPVMSKSPKSSQMGSTEASHPHVLPRQPLATLTERMGKENIHVHSCQESERELPESDLRKSELPDKTINDSIDAVIARACAEREPDPFEYSSESESDGFSSPRRLTIMEPATPKLLHGANSCGKDTTKPFNLTAGPGNWTMDDSINEVIRQANRVGPSDSSLNPATLSSPSASPPTPKPLLKVYKEKNKLVSTADIKKKLRKELKTKIKKNQKAKTKEKPIKAKERGRLKLKEKIKNKHREKNTFFAKVAKIPVRDFSSKKDDPKEHFRPRDLSRPVVSLKGISREAGNGSRKEKDKHKDRKKDKEKSKKDKDKRGKGQGREQKRKLSTALTPFGLSDVTGPLFSPSTCLRIPSMFPALPPIVKDRDSKTKEKDKKKDKKEKKKKEKDKERAKEKEREKEEKRKEKETREEEKERFKLEMVDSPVAVPSPVIPRLTLRVRAGEDKIVISKVPNLEAKTPVPKIPAAKTGAGVHPRIFPPTPTVSPLINTSSPHAPASSLPASLSPVVLLSSGGMPVRSVVTETVSTYVVRDEWGNRIWICPGCKKPDDGSPMIGCDGCDDWYHWPCVGMLAAPPEDQEWFCVKCASKKKDRKPKKRKHKMR